MNLKIYQTFYSPEQYVHLEVNEHFIPYNNVKNEHPDLREYPIIKSILKENESYDGYLGVLSWKWREKTETSGDKFVSWIEKNPGYDAYLMNPYIHTLFYDNAIIEGERHHPGMVKYFIALLKKLGYFLDVNSIIYPLNIISYCSFCVANKKFWNEMTSFIDLCIEVTKNDPDLNNYMFNQKTEHQDKLCINYSFIIERLQPLFLYLNKDKFNTIHYPYLERITTNSKYEQYIPLIEEKGIDLYRNRI